MSSPVVDRLEVCFTGFLEISHLLFSLDLCCFDSTTSSLSEVCSNVSVETESDTLSSHKLLVIPRLE